MTHLFCLGLLALQVASTPAEDAVYRFRFAPAKAKSIDGYVRISEKDVYAPGKPGLPGKPGWVGGAPQTAQTRGWQIPLDGKVLMDSVAAIPHEAYDRYRREAALCICDLMVVLGRLSSAARRQLDVP